MNADLSWASLRSFATGFEADEARAILEEAGILVLVRGLSVGIFGAGFQGAVPGGVEVLVPAPEIEHAQSLLAEWLGDHSSNDTETR